VCWSNASQRYRFRVLTEIAPLESATVLDYGCGKGDLYCYLLEAGYRGTYTGFDINPELLELARAKYPGVRFEQRDIEQASINEQFEYVLISGIFNNRISDNEGCDAVRAEALLGSNNAWPGFQRDLHLREFPRAGDVLRESRRDIPVLHDRPQPLGYAAP